MNGAPNCVMNAHSGPFAEVTNAMTAVMAKDDTVQGVDQTLSSLSDVARRYQVLLGDGPSKYRLPSTNRQSTSVMLSRFTLRS